jgi:predicted ribosomally synthesized peptide with SipW-like signal peptide
MNAVSSPSLARRAAVLLLLAAGLVLGAALPSWASFTDSVAVQTTVTTADLEVPAPTARATCSGGTAAVTVNWNASTAPRVSGYKVRLWLGAAWQDTGTVTGTTWSGNTSTTYVNGYVMTFTVFTLTPYGWTAESAHSAQVFCT